MVDLSGTIANIAALSIATERVTEFIKNIPFLQKIFTQPQADAAAENWRESKVHLLAALIGTLLCASGMVALNGISGSFWETLGKCFGYGVLASGGSAFWNGALDTLHSVKSTKPAQA